MGSVQPILCLRTYRKCCQLFLIFHLIWIQFSAGEVHTAVLSNCAVHENHCIECSTFLRDENELLYILATFIVQCGGKSV